MSKEFTTVDQTSDAVERRGSIAATNKTFIQRIWPSFACGAGLFSDGYLNSVIGSVNTILSDPRYYGDAYSASAAQSNVSSIAFVGAVVGQLLFGYTSDVYSRKNSLLISTIILIVFAILGTAAYGTTPTAFFNALVAFRFFLGIGIGGEYPAGSTSCAESTGELKAGTRNRWFIMFTNVAIDIGFVVGAIVPMIVILCTTEDHLEPAWRIMLGIGIIFPLSLFFLRLKLHEPESFSRESFTRAKTPYWLAIKFYGVRLVAVSLIWFIYDFSSYSFGTFSSELVANLLGTTGNSTALWVSFGWNTLINFFYVPGAIAGSWVSDAIGPRMTLIIGVLSQAVVGFIMAGCINYLYEPQYVAAFAVVYGIFLSLGELGPGDNIGLLAAKTSATGVRARYYGFAAAIGKIGAFCGTQALGRLIAKYPKGSTQAIQIAFWIAGSLAIFSAFLAFFFIPHIDQDTIDKEDSRFRTYLQEHGYDTTLMGLGGSDSTEALTEKDHSPELNPYYIPESK